MTDRVPFGFDGEPLVVPIAGLSSGTGTVIPHERVPLYVWVVVSLFTGAIVIVCVGWSWWIHRDVSTQALPRRKPLSPFAAARLYLR